MRSRIQVIQMKSLQREKIQSKDLTLEKELVIQKMDTPTWTQSSQDSVSWNKEDLGLLAEKSIPKA